MASENTPPLKLTRNQLASFLKDQRQIKAFENLFEIAESIAPDVVQQILIQAGGAQATANQAVAELSKIIQDAAISCNAAEAKAQQALDAIETLKSSVDLLALSPPPMPIKRTCFGSFFDTTTQAAPAINTAVAMSFNNTDLSFGVHLGSSTSEIVIDQEGIYNIQFSAQLDNTSGGNHLAFIWLRVNGANVPYSASQVRLKSTDGELVAAWNFFYKFKAGDYFEMMWSVSDTAVKLTAQSGASPVPAIPSVILTVCDSIRNY